MSVSVGLVVLLALQSIVVLLVLTDVGRVLRVGGNYTGARSLQSVYAGGVSGVDEVVVGSVKLVAVL